jgi:hypothetical protein
MTGKGEEEALPLRALPNWSANRTEVGEDPAIHVFTAAHGWQLRVSHDLRGKSSIVTHGRADRR